MIVFKFNPATKSWDDRNEICEALKGERAFIDNEIMVSDAPERGEGAFDLIIGGTTNKEELIFTITYNQSEEES